MPARVILIAALLVLVGPALAGCIDAPIADPTPDGGRGSGSESADVIPWAMEDCAVVVAFARVDGERLRQYLPEGFEPVAQGPFGIGPLASPYLAFEAFSCASGVGLDGNVTPLQYGSYFTAAAPPAGLEQPDVAFHLVKWDTLVPDAPRRAALQAAGLPAREGAATVPDGPPTTPGARVDAALELDGVGVATLTGVLAQSYGSDGVNQFVEFMPREDGGLGLWRATYGSSSGVGASGRGVLTFPAGSWPADVLGGESAPADFFTSRWTFSDGTITLDLPRPDA